VPSRGPILANAAISADDVGPEVTPRAERRRQTDRLGSRPALSWLRRSSLRWCPCISRSGVKPFASPGGRS